MITMRRVAALLLALAPLGAAGAGAATFGDLSAGGPAAPYAAPGAYAPGPYASSPYAPAPGYGPGPYAVAPAYGPGPYPPQSLTGGPEGVPPQGLDAPGAETTPPMPASPAPYLPFGPTGSLPHGRLQLSTFGQVNSTTDPFNSLGLSTPYMFVPWSTPLSGWTNAQTWNWWRERSGALPRNW